MITVVIVDDHPVVRAGLKLVLNTAADIRILAEGASGMEALRLVKSYAPDVLILDVNLPDLTGLEVTQRMRSQGTKTPILILTVHADSETIFGLLESGATGYVLKDEAGETLVSAVRAAARGETWLSPTVASQVVQQAVRKRQFDGKAAPPAARSMPEPADIPLTPAETEVLRLLAQGLDNAAIASRLTITKRTVQNHVSSIYSKLGFTSRTEAALYAIRRGLAQLSADDERPS